MVSSALVRICSLLVGAVLCVALLVAGITQEVPRGSLHARLTMKENGRGLPEAWVTLEYMGDDESGLQRYRYVRSKKDGTLTADGIPAGAYAMEVSAKAHDAKRRLVMVEEGKPTELSLAVEPKAPELELYAAQRVFTPAQSASFEIRGFNEAKEAVVRTYKLDLAKIVAKGGLSRLLYSFSRPGNEGGSDPSKSAVSVQTAKKTLSSVDAEGVFTEPVNLPKLDEGFYYVTCSVGDLTKATYLNVSTIGLVSKTAAGMATCYVADLVSGNPIAGASIAQPTGGALAPVGQTDAKGLLEAKLRPDSDGRGLLIASHGSSKAVVSFNHPEQSEGETTRLFVYTDRPIYRPGDAIQFKGLVRRLNGSSYSLPSGGQVAIRILDEDESVIQEMSLPVSDRGSFHGSYTSNVEDKPGSYSIRAKYGKEEVTHWLNIASYRKPELSVKITPTKKKFVYGERASAVVKAEYYFGGPAIGAKVIGYISRSTHYAYRDESDEEGQYDEGGPEGYSSYVGQYHESIELTTDEKGEALISFDTKGEGDPDVADADLDYSIGASVTDSSNKYVDAQGTILVVRGDLSADLDVDRYVAEPGDAVNATVTVRREETGEPVAGREAVLELGREVWVNDSATFNLRRTLRAVTDANGVARFSILAGSEGSMRIKSAVRDDGGRIVKSESYLYVSGDTFNAGERYSRFVLTLDKKSYKPGDICRALIETDKPGGSAIVTIQAQKVLASYVVELTSQSTIVKIPVLRSFQPNVFVAAARIQNKRMSEVSSRLIVDAAEHDLVVTIQPDKPDYQPGEVASLSIKTTDSQGKAMPAEVSLGVVDESIYAIRPDSTNIKRGFYPMRQDSVQTNYSFEEIYLDGGDKAGGNIPVRSKFLDTADFQPVLQTDASGLIHTTVKLPDNLTSWRATAVGITDDAHVGIGRVNFRARKPLSIRLEVPGFLVQQDTQRISAIVTNDTGKDQEVSVRLDAQGVQVAGQTSQKIQVPSAKPQTIVWEVQAPNSGEARFTAYAWTDSGPKDAEARTITVQPHGRLDLQTHSGEIVESATAQFNLSPMADKATGRLRLTISPSIGTSIYQSLDELIDFPYGCVEQTMSRFLPAVSLDSLLKQQGIRSDLSAKIPAIAADGFARLAKMQHTNGAWGWWENDPEDLFMTAYVLDGLKRAAAAGFTTDKIDADAALGWAKKQMREAKLGDENRRDFLYLCAVLAEYGEREGSKVGLERIKPVNASEFALAALTAHRLGDHALASQALGGLRKSAILEGDVARFESGSDSFGAEGSAFPLMALTQLAPGDPLLGKVVRYLMLTRRGDMWNSTRDSALALVALADTLKDRPDMASPSDIEIRINGGPPRTAHLQPNRALSRDLTVTVPLSELAEGENTVEFRRSSGQGSCYFTGELRQSIFSEHLDALPEKRGLTLLRHYYLLEPQRLENGGMELLPSRRSIDQARSGDLIRVELTVYSDRDREYMMIEDPIPSGCRITEREYLGEDEEWTYWWSQLVVRDDRASFFIRNLAKGTQKLSYTMRAEQVGVGHALPATLSNMYDPEQSHSTTENLLKVSE